ncbi:PA domain-containing protein [Hirschfeldia incana]|nr:PA domain-containing protein [Hirschfeldia incana]
MCSSFLSSPASFFTFLLYLGACHISHGAQQSTYIVHMEKSQMPMSFDQHSLWYESSLKSVSESAELLYSYSNAMHGFSARLTPEEADTLMTHPGVISVLPEQRYELDTTRSPHFLGLDIHNAGLYPETTGASSDVVVGVFDSGVWPESKSFSDEGYGPIPPTWKGGCETGTNFTASLCNRKLVGARFFARGYEATSGPVDESRESRSPRDDTGHGTHTSSTAAGSVVEGASLLGFANGTARGVASRARVAVYKVCWRFGGCSSADLLAGIDKAIEDNVNVISMSLSNVAVDYYADTFAIVAFAAVDRGIFVSCSAGNRGPSAFSVRNVAPWITTVGAGTIDREFPALVTLGNGKNYTGASLFKGDALPPKLLPFVYAGNASNNTDGSLCYPETLIPERVKGKIVLCEDGGTSRIRKAEAVKDAGGLGMIVANTEDDGEELQAAAYLSLAANVGLKAGDAIRNYVLTDPNPTATIVIQGTVVNVQPAPVLAAFSSRGPNPITPNILKPDLIAPGVNILAAWTGVVSPTGLDSDTRRVEFNILSGTSMSCPHVSGVAALLKSVHPHWSPAAIRSALMTTAYNSYKDGKQIIDIATVTPSTPNGYGAGHVSPAMATDPGLIYDLTTADYLDFLCAMSYTSSEIQMVSRRNHTCDPTKTYSVADLNYPSFAVYVDRAGEYKYTRTVTNVGGAGTYSVKVTSETTAVKILVEPAVLNFEQVNEKKSYVVTFTIDLSKPSGSNSYGSIEWSDGKHVVSSPVAVFWSY